jgi:hypothetical protein
MPISLGQLAMERLTDERGKDVWLAALSSHERLRSPFAGEKFALMLVHFAGSVSDAEKMSIARHLIAEGCRYAVCAGHQADEWEDAFDQADIEVNPDLEAHRFVMTTSHASEPLEKVAWFFVWNTSAGAFEPRCFLVVTIDATAGDEAQLRSTLAKVLADAA